MARTRISQREARRLQRRVKQLVYAAESQRRVWAQEFIGGAEIGRAAWSAMDAIPVAVRTALRTVRA